MDIQEYPRLNASFQLDIDDLGPLDFSECTGLAGEIGVEEYQEGGENRFAHRFPSRGSFPNLVFKRGTTANPALWEWYEELQRRGQVRPRGGQVLLLAAVDGVLEPVRGWAFRRGWPVKISGPDLNAMSPAVAVESIELVHHGLSLVTV